MENVNEVNVLNDYCYAVANAVFIFEYCFLPYKESFSVTHTERIDLILEGLNYAKRNNIKKIYLFQPLECASATADIFNNNLSDLDWKELEDIEVCLISGGVSDDLFKKRYPMQMFKKFKHLGWKDYFARMGFPVIYRFADHEIPSKDQFKTSKLKPNSVTMIPPLLPRNPKKSFSCFNGRVRPHRALFLDMLYKESLFEHGYISWLQVDREYYGQDLFKWWNEEKLELYSYNQSKLNGNQMGFFPAPQYRDSLFSIITETSHDVTFFTEKTFTPILNKRPFIIFGAKGQNRYLKSMGFELFDEIIDYKFDEEPRYERRAELLVQEVKKITEYDLTELYHNLFPKIQHNFVTLLEGLIDHRWLDPEIKEIINEYHECPLIKECHDYELVGRIRFFKRYLQMFSKLK